MSAGRRTAHGWTRHGRGWYFLRMITRALSGSVRHAALVVAAVTLGAGAGCNSCRQPSAAGPAASGAAAEGYRVPPDGTTSLVRSLTGHRTAAGAVVVDGRLLLPEGTRIWVEVYPATSKTDTPLDRAELYLEAGGSFQAGPFTLPPASQYRLELTSKFDRNWQPRDVLGLVGPEGTKLPKSALASDNPQAPGGHLQYSALVTISRP